MNWIEPLLLEQNIQSIINKQEEVGVQFDMIKAIEHVHFLESEKQRLYSEIRPHLKYAVKGGNEIKKPFKMNGQHCLALERYALDISTNSYSAINWMYNISGPFTRVEFREPSLTSHAELKEHLYRLGWKPDTWNYKKDGKGRMVYDNRRNPIKTSPKLTESSYQSLPVGVGESLAKYLIYSHRLSQLTGLMKHVRNDSTIPAIANPLGTPTARFRHSVVVNIPKNDPHVLFGKEMRGVFIARPGRVLVGHDASGLEARVGGHWAWPYDDGMYAYDVLEGDWHSKNAREVYFPNQCQGLSDDDPEFKSYRSIGKGGSYCTMYGGQPPKLAETLGIPLKEAKKIYEAFWEVNKGLGLLKDHLTKVWKRDGCIYTIDGRPIYPRKEGDLINYLNQSSGAIIMKRSAIILNKYVNIYNVDAIKVIDYHDEAQADVHPSHADFYGKLAVKSIREAGKYYNMNVELDSEYIIGNNWAECH